MYTRSFPLSPFSRDAPAERSPRPRASLTPRTSRPPASPRPAPSAPKHCPRRRPNYCEARGITQRRDPRTVPRSTLLGTGRGNSSTRSLHRGSCAALGRMRRRPRRKSLLRRNRQQPLAAQPRQRQFAPHPHLLHSAVRRRWPVDDPRLPAAQRAHHLQRALRAVGLPAQRPRPERPRVGLGPVPRPRHEPVHLLERRRRERLLPHRRGRGRSPGPQPHSVHALKFRRRRRARPDQRGHQLHRRLAGLRLQPVARRRVANRRRRGRHPRHERRQPPAVQHLRPVQPEPGTHARGTALPGRRRPRQ